MIAALLLVACNVGTGPTSAVSGAWHYTGSQATPAAQLDGSLSWTDVSSTPGTFEGTFTIVETAGVQQRTLVGASAGQLVADSIVDFDFSVSGGASRHHLGVLRSDSISGQWTELGGNGASGQFVLHRNTSSIR
jgi:hypothetical protein